MHPQVRAAHVTGGVAVRPLGLLLVGVLVATVTLLPAASLARAAGVTMSAKVLLGGNTRLGTWAAIAVDMANDGPAVSGELRLTGGSQGRTRYAVPVDLPTGSSKRFTLYAQPSPFRSTFDLALVAADGSQVVGESLRVVNHDPYTPLVAVVAERPQALLPQVTAALAARPDVQPASAVTLTTADLPDRVEAWGSLDRLVWQDVPAADLSSDQLAALRGWVAGGGRLVVLGGTSGSGVYDALADAGLLPYRPGATAEVSTSELTGFLGPLPAGASALPAMAGTLTQGRPLARSGDLVGAALTSYGLGSVTLIGFDPTTEWLAVSAAGTTLWRLVLPVGGTYVPNAGLLTEDYGIVQALYVLPALDLPPIDTLIVLLVLYTLLIGPLNYLVLRRLDRREWAWLTMPALVLVFSLASYGLGLTLHGTDTIVNEISIVRGAAGTDAGRAQVYIGIYSPTRRAFDVDLQGPALVTSTLSETQQGSALGGLDVMQGQTARVRGLEVTVADLRAFRGELPVRAPLVEADLRLEGATVKGTITNRSGRTLERPAVILGTRATVLRDLAGGESAEVSIPLGGVAYGPSFSEQIFGAAIYEPTAGRALAVRRAVLDQVSQGATRFPASFAGGDRPILVAWDSEPVVTVTVGSERPQQVADTMVMLTLPLRARGAVTLSEPLVGHQVVESDAMWASDDGYGFSLGEGSMTVSYQAIPLDGELHVTRLVLAMLESGNLVVPPPAVEPLPPAGAGAGSAPDEEQQAPAGDEPLPEKPIAPETGGPGLALFDRATGAWIAFEPLGMGRSAVIADPARYVDASGALLVRFSFDDPLDQGQQVYFNLGVRIEGVVQ